MNERKLKLAESWTLLGQVKHSWKNSAYKGSVFSSGSSFTALFACDFCGAVVIDAGKAPHRDHCKLEL